MINVISGRNNNKGILSLHNLVGVIVDTDINPIRIGDIRPYTDIIENELKRLYEIENRLGIDLITLFKLIDAGKFYAIEDTYDDDEPEIITEQELSMYDLTHGEIFGNDDTVGYDLKYYGKTWALTKEELEKVLKHE